MTLVYFLLAHKYRYMWLLAASCYFYMYFKPEFILILALLGLWLVANMNDYSTLHEGFDGDTAKEDGAPTEERHDYETIYDDFYAGVYDKLFETPGLISFQKASIREFALNEWAK